MNATLEATARAIFKSWFVDFDPVHAKANGEQPVGMDAEIAALFPDSFEDSPLGAIPAGWRVARCGSGRKRYQKGRSYKSSELAPSGSGFSSLKSFFRGEGYSFKPEGQKP